MDVGEMLLVIAPAVVGLASLLVGILLLRPNRGESKTSLLRTLVGIACILFMIACLFATFALGLCVGIAHSIP